MSLSITNTGTRPVELPGLSAGRSNAVDFRKVLETTIDRVEQSRADAEQKVRTLMTDDSQELHSVALATQRAELEFELLLQIRNKVVSAYQEVMRMQV